MKKAIMLFFISGFIVLCSVSQSLSEDISRNNGIYEYCLESFYETISIEGKYQPSLKEPGMDKNCEEGVANLLNIDSLTKIEKIVVTNLKEFGAEKKESKVVNFIGIRAGNKFQMELPILPSDQDPEYLKNMEERKNMLRKKFVEAVSRGKSK